MTVDLSPIVTPILSVIGVVLTALAAYITNMVRAKFKLDKSNALVTAVNAATTIGAGAAYSYLASRAESLTNLPVKNEALGKGLATTLIALKTVEGSIGLSEADLKSAIEGQLGKLLAVDPTITVGPAPAPAAR